MDDEVEKLIAAREQAKHKVQAWRKAGLAKGQHRDPTKAPAWQEYMDAFDALDKMRARGLKSVILE